MSATGIGVLGIIALFLLLVASFPVAFAMAIVGVAGFAAIVSPHAAQAVLAVDFLDAFMNYGLSVIPLFVFMGQVCFHSGISGKLFRAADRWFGALPGGLAMATVGACAAFGAICGSGPATAATMAAAALPEMRKSRYDSALAAGVVAAGGGLGMLIPPSVVFIVYGILTEQSIGRLFIAGIVPGLLVAGLFCATIAGLCIARPCLAPRRARASWREKFSSLAGVAETLALFALVLGGMFAGWFTPTEGAAVGAAGSLAIAAISGKLNRKLLSAALDGTVKTSCMVMVIVAGATVFGHFLAVTGIPAALANSLAVLPLPGWCVMLFICLFYLIAGCFIDSLALVMLTVPIFHPVIVKLGYDPVWFGVLVVMVTQMGVITPPVGVNVYVVSGMDRSTPIQDIFRGAMPFLFALAIAVLLILFFPGIATWL